MGTGAGRQDRYNQLTGKQMKYRQKNWIEYS